METERHRTQTRIRLVIRFVLFIGIYSFLSDFGLQNRCDADGDRCRGDGDAAEADWYKHRKGYIQFQRIFFEIADLRYCHTVFLRAVCVYSIIHSVAFVQCAKVFERSAKRCCIQPFGRVLSLFDVVKDQDGIVRHKAVENHFCIRLLQPHGRNDRSVSEDHGKDRHDTENEHTDPDIDFAFGTLQSVTPSSSVRKHRCAWTLL